MANRPLPIVNNKNASEDKDEITLKKDWLQQNLQSGPANGPNSLRIYREDVRALLITEFGGPISDLEVGLLLRQAFPKHCRKGKYYCGIGINGKHPTDVAVALPRNPQSLIAVADAGSGEIPNMLKPMKKRAIEAWRQENGKTKSNAVEPEKRAPEPIVRPWPHQALPPRSDIPPGQPPPGIPIMDKGVWRQMLVQMKQPLPIPPLDPLIRGPPGQPPGLLPGFSPGLQPGMPPGLPPGTLLPGMVSMPTPVSSMVGMSMTQPLNTQAGPRVDSMLGINRQVRGRKRSVGMERPGGGKRPRRRPEEESGMIDLAAAGGMTPHQKELSKIQPIILNFEIPVPKLSPPKPIEQRLANLSDRQQQGAEGRLSSKEGEGSPRHQDDGRVPQEVRRNVHLLPEQRPGQTVQPGIVVTSYPDTVPQLHLPQPGSVAPAPGHIPPPIQTTADGRTLSPRSSAMGRAQQPDLFKKPDIGKFEAVTGAKCFICRLAIPPSSKDFPSRATNIVTCSRCKKVAFGAQKNSIEPIPKFPTACNALLAEKMTKLRKAQAVVRLRKKVARQRAMGITPGGSRTSASAPSSPSPRSPMPLSPASLPPRSPGTYMPRSPGTYMPKSPGSYMPRSPIPQSANSLPPPSPNLMLPHSPAGSLPPLSPNAIPPKSPLSHLSRSPHCLQPKSPMSLPPRSPCSMPPSPQAVCHSYPASPSGPNISRPPRSPLMVPRMASPGSLPENQAETVNLGLRHNDLGARNTPLSSPRHPQIHEQSPASSTSSERLSLPPGREQDDTTIRALLQLGRPADRPTASTDANGIPVVVLQRGATPTSAASFSSFPQPFMVPSSIPGEQTSTSLPNMISAGGQLIPVMSMVGGTPTSSAQINALPPGYPTAALPFLVQSLSPGAIRPPGPDKASPAPKISNVHTIHQSQPQYTPSPTRNKVPKQPRYLSPDGNYVMESSDNPYRPDSIVIVGTNCAGSSSITVGNDPKDNYLQVPPLQGPKQQVPDMYGKPGFTAFYCSCSGRQIMLLQCPDCDFVCNNLFGMELHIAAQRHAESRAKAAATDVLKYGGEQGGSSNSHKYGSEQAKYGSEQAKYGSEQEMQDDEVMSQSSVDTQSADMDTEISSPRNARESHHGSDYYPSPGQFQQDNWTDKTSVISTGHSSVRRDSLSRASTPNLSSSPFGGGGTERSAPLDLRSEREQDESWSSYQDRCRKSVVVSHSRGSITEGTPLDLSGYSRTSGLSGKDTPTSEAQFVLSHKLGNIGSVIERSLPLDLSGTPSGTPTSTQMQQSENNRPSRPSSVQSNSSLGSLGNVLERPPATIDLSRLQPSTLSNPGGRPSWPFPRASTYIPPPSKSVPMTNPFLALSMHAARASKRTQDTKTPDTVLSKTNNKDVVPSVPSMHIPAGVAAASTLSRPPSRTTTTSSALLPTTELTRAPPAMMNLSGSPQRVLNYQGGTISIQPSDSHIPVASRTVLFSGGEPQTPEHVPEVRIKQEPRDSDEPTSCSHPSNGGMDEQQHARSSVEVGSSEGDGSQVTRSDVNSSEGHVKDEDETNPQPQQAEKQVPTVVIKQEVTSAN